MSDTDMILMLDAAIVSLDSEAYLDALDEFLVEDGAAAMPLDGDND